MNTKPHQPSALNHPGVRIPPPLIIAGFLALALILDQLLPLPLPLAMLPGGGWIGTAVIGCAFALMLLCVRNLHGADTTLRPDRPNTHLVRGGPYRVSRNPIYLGLLGMQSGLAIAIPSPWALSVLPLAWLTLDLYVVAREERYLIQRFGRNYQQFHDQIPRWM